VRNNVVSLQKHSNCKYANLVSLSAILAVFLRRKTTPTLTSESYSRIAGKNSSHTGEFFHGSRIEVRKSLKFSCKIPIGSLDRILHRCLGGPLKNVKDMARTIFTERRVGMRAVLLAAVTVLAAAVVSCNNATPGAEEESPFTPKKGAAEGAGGQGQQGQTPGSAAGQAFDPNKNPQGAGGAAQDLSPADLEQGRIYVNGWDGKQDELSTGSKWRIISVGLVAAGSGGTPPAGSEQRFLPQTTVPPQGSFNQPLPGTTGQLPPQGGLAGGAQGQVGQFSIPAGTGNGPWNSPSNPILGKVGQPIVITNNDSVQHQLHNEPRFFGCQHGNIIRANGGQERTCVPTKPFTGELYDHNTRGKVYFRVEQ
jgi:hypothetical protein